MSSHFSEKIRLHFQEWGELWIALAFYVAIVLLIQPWGEHPLNDDWYYAKPALLLATTGKLHILTGQATWAYPQILFGTLLIQLFGFSHLLLRGFGVACATGSAAVLYACFRGEVNTRFIKLLSVLAFLFFIPSFINGVSFMTDIPFLFLWASSCLLWTKAFKDPSALKILAATSMTLLCTGERQFGILFAPSVLAVWFYLRMFLQKKPAGKADLYFLISAFVQVLFYLFCSYLWNTVLAVPTIMHIPGLSVSRIQNGFFASITYAGLAASPILLMDLPETWKTLRQKKWLAWLTVLFSVGFVMFLRKQLRHDELMPYVGNQFSKYGLFRPEEIVPGPRSEIFSHSFMIFLTLFSTFSAILLFVKLVRWISGLSQEQILRPSFFLILSGFGYFAGLLILRDAYWDRYLIPLFFSSVALAALPLPGSLKWNRVQFTLSSALVVIFALSSLLLGQDYFKWTGARWDAGTWLIQQGVDSKNIEAGHEWNWWYTPDPVTDVHPPILNPETHGLVKFLDSSDTEILQSFSYSSWIGSGTLIAKKVIPQVK